MSEALQRSELHRKIWAIADEVRGAVDGWDFKQYILGILFYRFICENLRDFFNKDEWEAGKLNFNYANDVSDEEALMKFKPGTVNSKGFFILPSELFENVIKNAKNNENLNTDLARIFKNIEASAIGAKSEFAIKGLFDDVDTTSNRLGATVAEKNNRLYKILQGIASINFGNFEENKIDAFGDAYEYLISNYASNAGKSGGEFFTPQSVSKLLTKIVTFKKDSIKSVYDPACGSGSLLLQMRKQFDNNNNIKYFGQEINITSYNMARINMFLHNVDYNLFNIKNGDTLINPLHNDEKPFDAIVSNPPYSTKWVGDDNPVLLNDERYAPASRLAPKSYADFAFIMHSLHYLSSTGTAAIVCFPGIFYRKGAEKEIRKYLVDNNFIDAIIQLPPNLFFGTSIATCILVMAKNKVENKILFIDASNEFKKETNNNILSDENINKILAKFDKREDIKHFSSYVNADKIRQNDYNLSVSSYVEKEDLREKIDIKDLNLHLENVVENITNLRKEINKIVKEIEN